jgi:hypothetical protein
MTMHASYRARLVRAALLLCALLATSVAKGQSVSSNAAGDQADYVFSEAKSPKFEPELTVWMRSGAREPTSLPGVGLVLNDGGNNDSRFYFRLSPQLAAPRSVATLSAIVRTPPVSDTSLAWNSGTLGWRLIVDDGVRRLELGLARSSASGERQVQIIGATDGGSLPFPWDNNFHNGYEVSRRPSGEFVVTLTNRDPACAAAVTTATLKPNQLPRSTGRALFAWGTIEPGGGTAMWQEVHAKIAAPEADVGLTLDTRLLEIDLGEDATDARLEWRGQLTIPPGVSFNPAVSPVLIKLAGTGLSFETSVAAGSFTAQADGGFRFSPDPAASGPRLRVRFTPRSPSQWDFHVGTDELTLENNDLSTLTGTLALSNLAGSQTVTLRRNGDWFEFER